MCLKKKLYKIKFFLNYVRLKKKSLQTLKTKIDNVSLEKPKSFTLNYFSKIAQNTYDISYVISIKYTSANVFLQLTDCAGKLKFRHSTGHFVKGKQRKLKFGVFKKILNSVISKFPDLQSQAVAVHFVNVSNNSWLIKYFQKKLFVAVMKTFNRYPHNGCRSKKIRRKKYKKRLHLENN